MSTISTPSAVDDYAIANVQCLYDSGSETEAGERGAEGAGAGAEAAAGPAEDHTYGARAQHCFEPPAFLIHQNKPQTDMLSAAAPKIMTIAPGYPSVNLIQVADQSLDGTVRPACTNLTQPQEYNINKRIRRSEGVLRAAADCVSRGLTFQTVSEQFNIPISTIRFFMARKGILPRRRRGRSTQVVRTSTSPEPPFHFQHYKLPNMLALKADDDEQQG